MAVATQCIDFDTDAWSVMRNVVAPISTSGSARWRRYGTTGLGVVHAWIHGVGEYDSRQSNVAFNVGGGTKYRLKERFEDRRLQARIGHALARVAHADPIVERRHGAPPSARRRIAASQPRRIRALPG